MERSLTAQPETRLLLRAVGQTPDLAADVERAVADGIDWKVLLRLARSHRLVPHLASALAGQDGVPEGVHARLGAQARENALRQLRLTRALRETLDALSAAGVPSLPLKGPVLSEWLFGAPANRMSADLDVLVAPADIAAAIGALAALGFEGRGDARRLTRAEAAVVAREFVLKDAEFERSADGVPMELHWRPFKERGGAVAAALASGLTTEHTPPDLGPTPAVAAYVLLHGASHGFRRLGWLADAAALCSVVEDDAWREALALARADGREAALLLGPFLAHRLLGATLPDALVPAVERHRPRLVRLADGCLALTPDAYGEMGADRFRFQLALYDRLTDRARHVARFIVRPGDGELATADLRDTRAARARRALARPQRLLVRWSPRRRRR